MCDVRDRSSGSRADRRSCRVVEEEVIIRAGNWDAGVEFLEVATVAKKLQGSQIPQSYLGTTLTCKAWPVHPAAASLS